MNKKIPIEISIGIIVFFAVTFGYLFWKYGVSDNKIIPVTVTTKSVPETITKPVEDVLTTKPTDDFTNWQIYRNDEMGFEFKYPQSWFTDGGCEKVNRDEDICSQSFASYNYSPMRSQDVWSDNPNAPEGFIFHFSVYKNAKKINVDDFIFSEDGLNHKKYLGVNGFRIQQSTIGNNIFIVEEYIKRGTEENPNSYFGKYGWYTSSNDKSRIYWFDGYYFSKDGTQSKENFEKEKQYIPTFMQILSTLRLTK